MSEKIANPLIAQMRKIVRAERNSFAPVYQRGVDFLQNGEPEKAAEALSEAVRENPGFYLSYHYLGEAFYHLENYAEAEKAFAEAARLNPYFAATQAFLGDIAFAEPDIARAEIFYRKALDLNPKLRRTQIGLLKVFYKLYESESLPAQTEKNFAQLCEFVADDFELLVEMLDIHSPDPKFYRKLGDFFNAENQIEKALGCYHLALSLEPGNAMNLLKIADVCFEINEGEEASEYLRKATDCWNNSAEVYSLLGQIWSRQNRYAEAISAYSQALCLEEGNAGLYKIIGDLQSRQGLINDARLSYNRAIELGYKIY